MNGNEESDAFWLDRCGKSQTVWRTGLPDRPAAIRLICCNDVTLVDDHFSGKLNVTPARTSLTARSLS